jgi:spore coat protein CotF
MEKTFEMNKEMMKLMMEKAMYSRPNFSRREQ